MTAQSGDETSRREAAIMAAWEETEAILHDDPSRSIGDPTLPTFRVAATFELEDLGRGYEDGDRGAPMAAAIC